MTESRTEMSGGCVARGQRLGRVGVSSLGSSMTRPRASASSSCTEAARATGTTLSASMTAAALARTNWGQGGKTNQEPELKHVHCCLIMDLALMIKPGVKYQYKIL